MCLGVLATQVWLDTYATTGIRPAIAEEVLSAFSTASMRAALESARTQFRVAELDGHFIGFAQLTFGARHELVSAGSPAELERLYVQEPFARLGVGSALLAAAEDAAASAGATDLWLASWAKNGRALRFYAGRGYADIGVTCFRMGTERHENRVLSKSLNRLERTRISPAV